MCSSTSRFRSYWWPRRKLVHGRLRYIHLPTEAPEFQRNFSGQAADQRIYDTPQDMPFIDGFPDRLIREGLPGRLKRESVKKKNFPSDQITDQNLVKPIASLDSLVFEPEDFKSSTAEAETKAVPSETPIERNADHPRGKFPVSSKLVESAVDENGNESEQPNKIPNPEAENQSTTSLEVCKRIALPVVVQPEIEHKLEAIGRSQTIHILGSGLTGKFIAHSLAALPHPPPVTLVAHRPYLVRQWKEEGSAINVLRKGKSFRQSGVNMEPAFSFQHAKLTEDSKLSSGCGIDNLIVTTDAHSSAPAIMSIKHRLRASSTLCFLHDGLGVIDELNSKVFPDPNRRPNYALGNISHKLAATERSFTVVEKEAGSLSFTVLPRNVVMCCELLEYPLIRRMDGPWAPFRHLMRCLTRAPELKAQGQYRSTFLREQLIKVIVNSVVGPLTVMFDCSNEQLLYNYNVSAAMAPLLEEISRIISQLPEMSQVPRLEQFYGAHHLQSIVISSIKKSGKNTSAMLQAARKGRRTGVEYYNGFFVRRALELGIPCPHNQTMMSLVQSKQAIISREMDSYIPIIRDAYRGF